MVNFWFLFEYVAYAFSTKHCGRRPSRVFRLRLNTFTRISRGFELGTTHPVFASALKGASRLHADAGSQATVRRPITWLVLLAGEALFPRGAPGGGFCGLPCVHRFVS